VCACTIYAMQKKNYNIVVIRRYWIASSMCLICGFVLLRIGSVKSDFFLSLMATRLYMRTHIEIKEREKKMSPKILILFTFSSFHFSTSSVIITLFFFCKHSRALNFIEEEYLRRYIYISSCCSSSFLFRLYDIKQKNQTHYS
jgi:hypothetical protein